MTTRLDARACLGLLLVVTGIRSLGSPLHGLFQMLRFDADPDSLELLVAGLPLAMALFQIAAGSAFAFHKQRAGWIALAGYLVSAVGLMGFVVFEIHDVSTRSLMAMVVETIGFPIIVIVALVIAKPAGSSARRELGVMLIIYAITALLANVIRLVDQLRIIVDQAPSGPTVLSQLAWLASYVVVAVFQLRAGLQLYRGIAGRAVGAYAIAAIANELLWMTLYVIAAVVDGEFSGLLIPMHATSAFVSIALPLFLWGYVRSQPASGVDTRIPMAPAWNALLYVPFLAVRPVVLDELVDSSVGDFVLGDTGALVMATSFVAMAASTLLAGVLALRERMSPTMFAVIATVVGLLITSSLVVIMQLEPVGRIHTGPFLQIAVTTAVIAWLHRSTPIPRAVARA